MNIKEMEERSGLPRSGIRFYESEGLLSPARSANGYRDYSESDLETLLKIKRLRALGLTLSEIRSVQSGASTLAGELSKALARLGEQRGGLAGAEAECRAMLASGADWDSSRPAHTRPLQARPAALRAYFTAPSELQPRRSGGAAWASRDLYAAFSPAGSTSACARR